MASYTMSLVCLQTDGQGSRWIPGEWDDESPWQSLLKTSFCVATPARPLALHPLQG